MHAPGNSIGVQHILGDYANYGILRIEANPAQADKLVVAGSVDITGASLDLVLSPGNSASWDLFNGPFTILAKQSPGAVVGRFEQITQKLLFLDAQLAYDDGDGNDVTQELQRNELALEMVAETDCRRRQA